MNPYFSTPSVEAYTPKVDVPIPEIQEQIIEGIKDISQEHLPDQSVEQIVDAPRRAPGLVGARWVPWCRRADTVDVPCSARTDSICNSEQEHREWDLDLTECDWLSQRCRENQKHHLRSRRCQLLTAERQVMNPPA